MRRGLLVAIEGGDGAGKSTVRRSLYKQLSARGFTCLSTIPRSYMDAGSTRIFTLHKYGGRRYPAEAIVNAYVTDRAVLGRYIVEPAISAGMTVLLDRYVWSDVAYLSHVHKIDSALVIKRLSLASISLPDVTIYVHNNPEIAIARIQAKRTQVHAWERVDAQRRVIETIERMAAQVPGASIIRVTNDGSKLQLQAQLDHVLDQLTGAMERLS